jgi:hypothetical protein
MGPVPKRFNGIEMLCRLTHFSVKKKKIKREIKILENLRGGTNIITLQVSVE